LAWFGMDRSGPRDQEIEAPGFKLHMNAIAAAMGLAGLEGLDDALAACRRNATIYRGALGGRDVLEGASPWTWTVFVENPADFIAYMHGHGVTVGQPHRRNDANDFAASTRRSLPGVDFAQAHYCSIPVGWWVDAAEAARIAGLVSAFPGLLRL
ncbi:MAG: DegT/DnrJ/EryC1/StrS family aminotransferase, partial [Dehalococcoidia bacterium]|nr:DegT/DnrJ/EryC1/StrS family aminotransferase [Dehalococcoidia bacterium]